MATLMRGALCVPRMRADSVDLTGITMAPQGIMQQQADYKLVPYTGRSSLASSSCASEVCRLPSDYCRVCVEGALSNLLLSCSLMTGCWNRAMAICR